MSQSQFSRTERKILWKKVQAEVLRKTEKTFSLAYLQQVYSLRLSSVKMKNLLDEIIDGKKSNDEKQAA